MKQSNNKLYILLVLVVVFLAPGIGAYILYKNPDWLGEKRTNRGELLKPPVHVELFGQEKKWRIVYWTTQQCEQSCLNDLEKIAKVRLALGRKLYQVEQWFVLGDNAADLNPVERLAIEKLDFKMITSTQEGVDVTINKIFIADPNDYLILAYKNLANPEDIYKDLKLLINATEKNG